MSDSKQKVDLKKVDPKEFELPETIFVRDIDNKVFQGIVLQCMSQIDAISLVSGNLIDNLFSRSSTEPSIRGIHAEQDSKNHSVNIKVEVNICYGYNIPEKAEEIQTKITEDITKLTGLHVGSVHVIFKNVVSEEDMKRYNSLLEQPRAQPIQTEANITEEYTDEF